MAIVFTLLFNKMVLGMTFHEIAGLVIGAVVLVHCSLNFKWVKGVTLKIFDSKTKIKTRIGYILDILLLITVAVIIISGIFISKILFGGLGLSSTIFTKSLHITASYFALILIGVHVGLHWKWVMVTFKKMFKIPSKKIYNYISKVLVVLVLVFGIYSINSAGFISKLSLNSSSKVESNIKAGVKPSSGEHDMKPSDGNLSGNSLSTKGGSKGGSNGESNGDSNVFSVITQNLGIISTFSITVYYLEKLVKLRKKNA